MIFSAFDFLWFATVPDRCHASKYLFSIHQNYRFFYAFQFKDVGFSNHKKQSFQSSIDSHRVSQNKNKVSEISHFCCRQFGNGITLFLLRKYMSLLFSFVLIGAFLILKSHFIFENSQQRLWVCLWSRLSLAVPFLFFQDRFLFA